MTSGWYFEEPLRNQTENFLISKLCFPWLVYTLTPWNSTHYYLTSSISPFSTETKKKFSAESETTENLRMYSVKAKYFWWIYQPSSASRNLHLWFELILAIGHFVNSRHLWFLCRTIINELSAWKTEQKVDHGNVLSQRGGVSQYTREAYAHKERKGHPQTAWKLKETVSKL